MPLSRDEEAVLAAVDEDDLVRTLQALLRIPSLTGDEGAAQRHLADVLREDELAVDFWPLDLAALREECDRAEGFGLAGTWGGDRGPRLILNGHVDVVPIGSLAQWHADPWGGELRHGNIYGRGACDMKGGLAAGLVAIRAVRRAGLRLRGSVQLQSVVGEEDGGLGTLATIRRGHRGDAAVIMEPTELSLVPAQAGALSFSLAVPGRAAHACVRLEGVSAIEKFWPLFQALRDLERRRNTGVTHPLLRRYMLPYPISIGTLHAGNWSSSVPEDLVARGRYGVAMGEDLASARRDLEESLATAAALDPWMAEHPPRLSWTGGQFAPAETATAHPFVHLLRACATEGYGREPAIEGATYGSDLRLLVHEAGIPTVLFGPGGGRRAHMPDEFVAVDQLTAAARSLALLITRFCGIE
jgi:acetylornithine deacetylase